MASNATNLEHLRTCVDSKRYSLGDTAWRLMSNILDDLERSLDAQPQPRFTYAGTDREIRPGDTVLDQKRTMGGTVYGFTPTHVLVAWAKWDPLVEACINDFVRPETLTYKGRN